MKLLIQIIRQSAPLVVRALSPIVTDIVIAIISGQDDGAAGSAKQG